MSYLGVRLDALRSVQNNDGGWGYFPRKQSWLEPTVYAALALHCEAAADRAWSLLLRWQARDGGWRPAPDVSVPNWGTALCVTLATVRGEWGDPLQRGVEWLLDSQGIESSLRNRAAARIGLLDAGRNLSLKAWPWKPGTSSWVEPTAHTLVALKKVAAKNRSADLADRVRLGESELRDVRCRDGGWNYGRPSALSVDLASYPETTALALVGLQGAADLAPFLKDAARSASESPSPLARAWMTIALRLHGADPLPLAGSPTPDLLVTALEALAAPEGNYAFLKTGGAR